MTNFNLARMNMFLYNINYNQFDIRRGDTLLNPQHDEETIRCECHQSALFNQKPTLISGKPVASLGELAPKSKADFRFYYALLY